MKQGLLRRAAALVTVGLLAAASALVIAPVAGAQQGNPPSVECASDLWNDEYWKVQVNDGVAGQIETNVGTGAISFQLTGGNIVWTNQHSNAVFRVVFKTGQGANDKTEAGLWLTGEGATFSLPDKLSHITFCFTEPPPTTTTPEEPAVDIEKATNGEDADDPTGPQIPVGDAVTWTYVVTNTGNVALTGVTVTDDQGVAVSCPQTTLAVGESMTCTAAGTATAGQYANVGSVTTDQQVSDSDPSHYFGFVPEEPAVDIEKATNGEDADTPTGPQLDVGDPVDWTYVVTNTGNVALTGVTVTDDQGVAVSCPQTTLAVGESMTCTAAGTATAGQYANVGSVTTDQQVSDSDPSHYIGFVPEEPAVDIEKATNGQDADTPTGPVVAVGSTVTWTYVVTNIGDVTLTGVTVTDDQVGAISCPQTTLVPGASMTCTAFGTAVEGQYANVGLVTTDQEVTDSDPSHYIGFVPEEPAVDIEKATNGEDADAPTGPQVPTGSTVTWTYVVTNTGNVTLTGVTVTDDQGVAVSCPQTTLAVGQSMTCTASGTATGGQYGNVGLVTTDQEVSDSDPSHYFGLGAIGDRVWNDVNDNGIQDPGEAGVAGATVRLFDADSDKLLAVTTTDADGKYLFEGLARGNYYLVFVLPADYEASDAHQGPEEVDSDPDPDTLRTGVIVLAAGQVDLSWDAGIFRIQVLATTIVTTVPSTLPFAGFSGSNAAGAAIVLLLAGGLILLAARRRGDDGTEEPTLGGWSSSSS